MRHPPVHLLKQMNIFVIKSFMILFLSSVTVRVNLCSPNTPSLNTLPLEGHFNFHEVQHAARDFGNRYQFLPMAILHPKTVSDIATLVKHIWDIGPRSELTAAARGHGHSLQGQSQAHRGVVINMESLKGPEIQVYTGNFPYADVSGGELWINILFREAERRPISWCSWRTWSVWHHNPGKNIVGSSTDVVVKKHLLLPEGHIISQWNMRGYFSQCTKFKLYYT